MVRIRDHVRPIDGSHAPGVYRVVGTTERVTLLRVTGADDRRAHTGEITRVSPERLDASFEPAADPDAGFSPVSSLRNLASGLYWSVRQFR